MTKVQHTKTKVILIVINALGAKHLSTDFLVLIKLKKQRRNNLQQAALFGSVHILRKVLSIPTQWFWAGNIITLNNKNNDKNNSNFIKILKFFQPIGLEGRLLIKSTQIMKSQFFFGGKRQTAVHREKPLGEEQIRETTNSAHFQGQSGSRGRMTNALTILPA